MSFEYERDNDKLRKILQWDGTRKATFSVDGADEWTREELSFLSEENWEKFRKNLENCQKDVKERNAENDVPALIEASRKVAVYRDTWYYEVNGIYQTSSDARRAVVYEAICRSLVIWLMFVDSNPKPPQMVSLVYQGRILYQMRNVDSLSAKSKDTPA